MLPLTFNHLALLVPSVQASALALEKYGLPIGPVQKWEGEGTLEVYVGTESHSSRLLLMEPTQEGPYLQALKKRGPGLHHIAIDVPHLENFIAGLSGSGWLLHPKSLQTFHQTRTAYLARPGTPTLIEVQEQEVPHPMPPLINRVHIPLSAQNEKLFQALGLTQVTFTPDGSFSLTIGNHAILLSEIGAGQ